MGIPSSDSSLASADHDRARTNAARDLLDGLAMRGSDPGARAEASRVALLEEMTKPISRGGETMHGETLCSLLGMDPSPAALADTVGKLLSLGMRGDEALRGVLAHDWFAGMLTQDEKASLPGLLDRPIEERLSYLAHLLESSARDAPNSPTPSGPTDVHSERHAALRPRELEIEEDDEGGVSGNGDGDDPATCLGNTARPEERRMQAALQLGEGALPHLVGLSVEPDQREFALASLVALGRQPECSREVRLTAMQMERDPSTKEVGQMVLDSLSGITRPSRQAPSESKGWLGRSFAQCSAPSILMAAAGREALAIPLVMQQIFDVRRMIADLSVH